MVDLRVQLPGSETDQPKFNYSSPVEAPGARKVAAKKSGMASAIEGVAAIGGGLVELGDKWLRSIAEGETEDAVDQVREEFAINGDLYGGRDITNDLQTVPEIEKQLKYANEINQGYMAGTIKDSNYWARLDSISRQLRTRYPGYREYIDAKMSSMVGGTPANRLREQLVQEAEAAARNNQEQSPLEKLNWQMAADFEKDGLLTRLYPSWRQKIQEGTLDLGALLDQAAVFRQNEYDVKVQQANITKLKGDKDLTADMAKDTFNSEATMAINMMFVGAGNEIDTSYEKMFERVRKLGVEGKLPKQGPEFDEILNGIATMELEATSMINKMMLSEWKGRPGESYDKYMSQEEKQAAVKKALAPIEALKTFMGTGEVGILDRLKHSIDYRIQGNTQRAMDADKYLEMLPVIKNIGGDAAMSIFLQEGPGLAAISTTLGDSLIADVITGNAPSGKRAIQDIKARTGVGGVELTRSVNYLKSRLLQYLDHDGATSEGFRNIANFLYDTDENFLRLYSREDAVKVLQELTNPAVTKRMKEMTVFDPSLYKKYERFAVDGLLYITTPAIQTVRDVKVNRLFVDVTFDPKTLKLTPIAKRRSGSVIVDALDPLGRIQTGVEAYLGDTGVDAINEVNAAFESFKPFADASGIDLRGVMKEALAMNGVDMDAQYEGPSLPNTVDMGFMITNAIKNAYKTVTEAPSANETFQQDGVYIGSEGTDDLGGGSGKDWFGYSPEQLDYMREIESIMGERGKEIVNALKSNPREPKGGVEDQRIKENEDGMPSDDFFMSLSLDPETDSQITIDKQKQEFNKKMKELSKVPLSDLMKEIKKQRWPADWKSKAYKWFIDNTIGSDGIDSLGGGSGKDPFADALEIDPKVNEDIQRRAKGIEGKRAIVESNLKFGALEGKVDSLRVRNWHKGEWLLDTTLKRYTNFGSGKEISPEIIDDGIEPTDIWQTTDTDIISAPQFSYYSRYADQKRAPHDEDLDYADWLARGYENRNDPDMSFKAWFDSLPGRIERKKREWIKEQEKNRRKVTEKRWNEFLDSITPW